MDSHSDIKKEEKLFNSGFITITTINFIVFLIYYCFVVITAKFATSELGATAAQAGLLQAFILSVHLSLVFISEKN